MHWGSQKQVESSLIIGNRNGLLISGKVSCFRFLTGYMCEWWVLSQFFHFGLKLNIQKAKSMDPVPSLHGK